MGEVYKARDSDLRKNFLTQAHLGKAGLAPDHLNKASITIRHVVIFFLVESLAFTLLKNIYMKHNKTKCNKMR